MDTNLAALVTRAAARTPGSAALVAADHTTTWAELEHLVRAFAGGLRARRVRRGDRVAMLVGNSPDFAVAYFGILRAGCVCVPINTGYTAFEVAYQVQQSGAELLICDAGTYDTAVAAAGTTPVVMIGSDAWRTLLVGSTPPPEDAGGGEDLAVLMFTSGTSGRPKGAMLSHRALLANLDQLAALDDPAPMLPEDIVLVSLPLFHSYALNGALGMVARTGATAVIPGRFDPAAALTMVGTHEVSVVISAPPVYQTWVSEPGIRAALAGVRLLISGAAPLTPAVYGAFEATTGLPVWEGYGMTEAAPVITSTLVTGRPKSGSVGQALPGIELRLHDETGQPVAEDDPGEIVIRGDNLFSGYWPDGTDGPDAEGWWATSDIAIIDSEGDVRLVDRRSDLIIVNGFNVYPREVEEILSELDGISEVAVMGVPDEVSGNVIKAVVVASDDLDSAAVISYARSRIARFKCPSNIEFVDSLPHSGSGKISKGALRERIAELRS